MVEPAGFDTDSTVDSVTGTVIEVGFALVGFVFFILMVYGGYIWLTAYGAEDRITKAKSIIIKASIGLAVILVSYFVSSLLIDRLLFP